MLSTQSTIPMIQFLKEYKFRLLNLFIMSCLGFYSFSFPEEYNYLTVIILASANAFIIQSLLLLIARYKIVFFIFAFIVSLFISFEVSQVAIYSYRFNLGVIASIFETNKDEASSMLSTIYKYIPLFLFIVLLLVSSFELARKEYLQRIRKKKWLLLGLILSLSIISFKSYRYLNADLAYLSRIRIDFKRFPLFVINNVYFRWTPSFFQTAFLIITYLQEQSHLKKLMSMDQVLPNSILALDTTQNKPKTIFIIIGESSNRNHYSLYGYRKKTTPMLDSLSTSGRLIKVKGISSASLTRDAVPFLMTFGTPKEPSLQYTEESIITLIKKNGYETYWISNQEQSGINDSPVGYIALRCDHISFLKHSPKDDLNLIKETKKIYSKNKNQLIVLHLIGSHQPYNERFDNIDSKMINNIDIEGSDEYSNYNKTIYHTDRVLGSLYEIFFKEEGNNNLLFYTSDHGEIVNIGHGFDNLNMDQFKIPFIAFGSSYFNKIDSLFEKYSNNGIFNSSNFPYVLAEIVGYRIDSSSVPKIKDEALYYKQVDGQILKFPGDIN